MPRDEPRPRRPISPERAGVMPYIGFRYSISRDAYVLRGVGNRLGPVYQVQRAIHAQAAARARDEASATPAEGTAPPAGDPASDPRSRHTKSEN